ncbi:MAG: hypothetical protein LBU16_10060 [Treponema sp.]|nr:hypothetical protein [Treponema sp.]
MLLLARSLHSLAVTVTGAETELDFAPEYSRVFGLGLTVSAAGSLELNERCAFRGGLALWKTAGAYEIDAALGFGAKPFLALPLLASVAWYYNALPSYEAVSHTALPLIGLRFRHGGVTLGTALRFSSYFNESAIFESLIAFEGYVNFYNAEAFRIGLRCANYDAFAAGNFGAYRLSLDSRIRAAKRLFLINNLALLQTGSVTMGANWLGVVYTTGAALRW